MTAVDVAHAIIVACTGVYLFVILFSLLTLWGERGRR